MPDQSDSKKPKPNLIQGVETRADELAQCQQEVGEWQEKYKRVLADYHNLETRMQIERQQYVKVANRYLLESLLEPIDFMETATAHIDDKGLCMVVDRFYQVLNQEGLEEIKIKAGDQFDEATMEAIDTVEGEDGKVVKVQQKGFRLNGMVIRHAKVVVGRS